MRKGSLIWVSGSLELEEYTKNDGETHDKRLKLKLDDWDYIPAFQGKTECGVPQSEPGVKMSHRPHTAKAVSRATVAQMPCSRDRMAEHLRSVYPQAHWEWTLADPTRFIAYGGTGRIRVYGIPDYDYAGVTLDRQGGLRSPKELTFKLVRDTRFSHDKSPYSPAFRAGRFSVLTRLP